MSYYMIDTLVGSSATNLYSHVGETGHTWPNDSNHLFPGGVIVLDGSGQLTATTIPAAQLSTATMPGALNFQVVYSFKRLTAITNQQANIMLTGVISTSTIDYAFLEVSGSGFAMSVGGTPVTSFSAYEPATGVKVWILLNVSTSGGNTTWASYYSTVGDTGPWTTLGIDYTHASPTNPIAIGPFFNSLAAAVGTGSHIGDLIIRDIPSNWNWNRYLLDLLAGANGTLLSAHTADDGSTWPFDGTHSAGGHTITQDGSGFIFQLGTSTGTTQQSTCTPPATNVWDMYFDFKRLSNTTTAFFQMCTNVAASFTSVVGFRIVESGVVDPGIHWTNGGTAVGTTSGVSIPTVGTLWRIRLRARASSSNTVFSAAYSTDGGVTYTDLAANYTTATSGLSAIGMWPYFADPTNAGSQTLGMHVGRLVWQDPTATASTLPFGPAACAAGAQTATPLIAVLDQPAGYGGVVVTPAAFLSGATFQNAINGSNVSTITIPQGSFYGFIYEKPGTGGSESLSITTAPVLGYGSSWTFTVTAGATILGITGPQLILVNKGCNNITVTPNGFVTSAIATITFTGAAASGISPVALTFTNTTVGQSFSVTSTVTGSLTYTLTNNAGLTPGSPITANVVSASVCKTVGSLTPSSTVTILLFASDGQTVINIPSSNLVTEIGSGIYSGIIPDDGVSHVIRWQDASGLVAPDEMNPATAVVSGTIPANLTQIGGVALTGTAAQLAAAFTTFYNVATPVGTVNAIPSVTNSVGSISGVTFPTRFSSLAIDANGSVNLIGTPKKGVGLSGFQFFLALTADHFSPGVGKTIVATRSIDGGAFSSCTNAATELGAGWYTINLSASDMNGTTIAFSFVSGSCDPALFNFLTTP